MGRVIFAAHDLVRVKDSSIARFGDAPPWVTSSLECAAWMVVRRGSSSEGVPVGIRGANRTERFAAHVRASDVAAHIVPEALCLAATRSQGRLGAAARWLAAYAAGSGLVWGPVGSFGFELASRRQTTTDRSDLDIVVRVAGVARDTLLAFHVARDEFAEMLGVSIDVELAFDIGGVALAEYAARPARVLVKTPRGPELLPCP